MISVLPHDCVVEPPKSYSLNWKHVRMEGQKQLTAWRDEANHDSDINSESIWLVSNNVDAETSIHAVSVLTSMEPFTPFLTVYGLQTKDTKAQNCQRGEDCSSNVACERNCTKEGPFSMVCTFLFTQTSP